MARESLRLALLDAAARGAAEGTADAVRIASRRRRRVRVTRTPTTGRALALAVALADLDAYDQEGTDG